MKKKIVSLVGALVLTCAMSLNVFAAESVTAEDIAEAAGAVTGVPTTQEELNASADAIKAVVPEEVNATAVTSEEALELTKAAAVLDSESDQTVAVVFMADLHADSTTLTVKMAVKSTETVWALHMKANGDVERILGTVSGDTVTFSFENGYSPVAIVKVAKAGSSAPAASTSTTTTTTTTTTVDGTTVPVAPKTGDVAMMVTVMAVIFMAGAAVAVVMSKKRA